MNTLAILAFREVSNAVRNRWIVAAVIGLGALALTLSLLGELAGGETRVSALQVAVANLSGLTVYLIPLIALMLSFDGIVGESERGTLGLLLSYPMSRWELVGGKFLGHTTVLIIALILGYGAAAIVIVIANADTHGWQEFVHLLFSSALLGAVFIALGLLLSTCVAERATAVGAAIGLWLLMVVIYDLGLLGALMLDSEHAIGPMTFTFLMLVNPTDAYRVYNLMTIDSLGAITGMTGISLSESLDRATVMATLITWVVAPLLLSILILRRREL